MLFKNSCPFLTLKPTFSYESSIFLEQTGSSFTFINILLLPSLYCSFSLLMHLFSGFIRDRHNLLQWRHVCYCCPWACLKLLLLLKIWFSVGFCSPEGSQYKTSAILHLSAELWNQPSPRPEMILEVPPSLEVQVLWLAHKSSLKTFLSIEMFGFSIQKEVAGVYKWNFYLHDSPLTCLFSSPNKGKVGVGGIVMEGVQSFMMKTEAWLNRPPCDERGSFPLIPSHCVSWEFPLKIPVVWIFCMVCTQPLPPWIE